MSAPDLARRRLLAGAGVAAAGAALSGCALPGAMPDQGSVDLQRPPAPAPQVALGDRWRYAQRNRYNDLILGETRFEVIETSPRLRLAVQGWGAPPDGTEEIHERPWQVLQEPVYDQLQRFETPQPVLPAQLTPGATQRWTGFYQVPGSEDRLEWTVWMRAARWERITVPAGSFDALRVDRRINFRHADLWRTQCERSETLWYAPQVNRWVRREWTGTYRRYSLERYLLLREDWIASELIEYQPSRG